ncbi:MAG: acetylornithine deacetylase or succinyl-diaminopimelate desuccinylase [Thermomicrobiales bacterium]|nr:acetylornithine deacetylase or succinyl-diaminopimelate desuccinylase [Thermomicrobiales bacterium]
MVAQTGEFEAAAAEIDRLFADYVILLQELVRQPSTLGDVRSAQVIVYRRLLQLGLDAHIQDIEPDAIAGHPDFAPVAWSSAGQPNVWGALPATGSGGRSLVLNGHVDVVPTGPTYRWQHDPWAATIAGDRMYGRGAMDMKGGLVAALLAIDAVLKAGIELSGPVIFESVIEEECTGNGMLAQRLQTGPVDGAIILEPTGPATWIATPGVLWFEVSVGGQAAYVGQGAASVNAIDVAVDLIQRFKPGVVQELNAAFDHPAFAEMTNPLTLNVGAVVGGGWPSSVPLACRFTCRMAYPIDWSFAQARLFVERHVVAAAESSEWLKVHPPLLRFPGFRAAGWEYRADPALLDLVDTWHNRESGSPLVRTGWPGTADGRYFDLAEPVVYYGPAGGNIHGPDEYVELESLRRVARALVGVIVEWCG